MIPLSDMGSYLNLFSHSLLALSRLIYLVRQSREFPGTGTRMSEFWLQKKEPHSFCSTSPDCTLQTYQKMTFAENEDWHFLQPTKGIQVIPCPGKKGQKQWSLRCRQIITVRKSNKHQVKGCSCVVMVQHLLFPLADRYCCSSTYCGSVAQSHLSSPVEVNK